MTTNITLKEMVTQHPGIAPVLEKYGLDFCCKGNRTLLDACKAKDIDFVTVETEINEKLKKKNEPETEFDKMEPDALIDYILSTHHTYVKENMPVIYAHTQKVARVHGEKHPENLTIAEQFDKVKSELELHMMKEEQILFPYIRQLVRAKRNGTPPHQAQFGTVEYPIRMMEHDHEFAGEALEQIRNLSHHFTPPENACTTYRLSYLELDSFEKDLHMHVHLENNILFPKAIALERELWEKEKSENGHQLN